MLQTPGNELSAFLLGRPDLWRAETFTERTFEAALNSAERFDCVVLGFNAVYQSEAIQQALAAGLPATGVLVLHQLHQKGLGFLPPDLTLGLKNIQGGVKEALPHKHADPRDEILLNWPEPVTEAGSGAGPTIAGWTICHLETLKTGVWRTSLEVIVGGNRLPVVLRTSSMRRPRVVVSTLQLEPRKPQHASLLRNMITYCAAGWPEVAVVEDEEGGRGADIARKLRVQGANAVELPLAAPGPLRFEEWPLRGVHEVLVDETWEPDAVLGADEAKKWLELGNTLVRLEGDGLTLRQGASDAHVVAQRWSAWFHGVEPALWHGGLDRDGADQPGSIFGTRAIMRMLALLQSEDTRAQPDRLGLEPPVHYSEPVLSLLTRRWQSPPSFEGTISTHTAAHDVLQLIGGAELAPNVAADVEDWLRGAFQDAATEDRLDIARCLGDEQLFRNAVGELGPKPLSAVLATRLRESAVACGLEPELKAPQLEELPPSDLESNLLLASEYVAARVAFSQAFKGHAWSKLDDRAMSLALAAIGKFGVIARASVEGVALDAVGKPPGEISTEARALIAYYNLDPSSTHAIRREAQGVPAAMVEAVLKTSNRARAAEAAAQATGEDVRQTLSAREADLRRAQNVFGIATAMAAVAFFGSMVVVIGHDLGGITAAFGLGALFFIVVSLPLHLLRLAPDWTGQVASTIGGGFSGLAANLAKLFRSGAERE